MEGWTDKGATEPRIQWQENKMYCYSVNEMDNCSKHSDINTEIPGKLAQDFGHQIYILLH